MADSLNSDEEENVPKLKKAATKKKHLTRPIAEIKLCGIYSTASDNIAIPAEIDCLPDSDADDEEQYTVLPIKKKKYPNRKKKEGTGRYLQSSEDEVGCYRSPKRSTPIYSVDSPSSPPPPPPDNTAPIQRPLELHDRETSNVLRKINIALTNVRCIQSEVSSQSDDAFSPVARTPGGSIDVVIDVDAPIRPRLRNSILVKVRSKSGIRRFPLKMVDTFSQIMDDIASEQGVQKECVKLTRDGQDITEMDSPLSINLHIADIIDCLIVEPGSITSATASEQTIEVTIQGQKKKSTMTRNIGKNDPLKSLLEEYSVFCGQSMDKLKFTFDGDVIQPTDTPVSLDFEEDGNTIDAMY